MTGLRPRLLGCVAPASTGSIVRHPPGCQPGRLPEEPAREAAQEGGKDPEALSRGLGDTPRMTSDGSSGPTSSGISGLDFWLGEWTCTWDGGGGRNSITRELGGAVVVERFESLEPERWSGMSLNVFDELHGWRQTWVDSTGNYWALQGRSHPEGFAFAVDEVENGRNVDEADGVLRHRGRLLPMAVGAVGGRRRHLVGALGHRLPAHLMRDSNPASGARKGPEGRKARNRQERQGIGTPRQERAISGPSRRLASVACSGTSLAGCSTPSSSSSSSRSSRS